MLSFLLALFFAFSRCLRVESVRALKYLGASVVFLCVSHALPAMELTTRPAALNGSLHEFRQFGVLQYERFMLTGFDVKLSVISGSARLDSRDDVKLIRVSPPEVTLLHFRSLDHNPFVMLSLTWPNRWFFAISAIHNLVEQRERLSFDALSLQPPMEFLRHVLVAGQAERSKVGTVALAPALNYRHDMICVPPIRSDSPPRDAVSLHKSIARAISSYVLDYRRFGDLIVLSLQSDRIGSAQCANALVAPEDHEAKMRRARFAAPLFGTFRRAVERPAFWKRAPAVVADALTVRSEGPLARIHARSSASSAHSNEYASARARRQGPGLPGPLSKAPKTKEIL
jgi:hypothetical protein